MHILVVDDDTMMAKTFCDIFKIKGYKADISFSGKEALEKLNQNIYNCVLSDIEMPDMNGLELYKIIKKKFEYMPVVLMTAYISHNIVEEAMKEGVVSVLTKPVNIKLFLDFIARLEEKKTTVMDDKEDFYSMNKLRKIFGYKKSI